MCVCQACFPYTILHQDMAECVCTLQVFRVTGLPFVFVRADAALDDLLQLGHFDLEEALRLHAL